MVIMDEFRIEDKEEKMSIIVKAIDAKQVQIDESEKMINDLKEE